MFKMGAKVCLVLEVSPSVLEVPLKYQLIRKVSLFKQEGRGKRSLDKILVYCVEGGAEVFIHSVQRVFILIYYRGSVAQNVDYVYIG